MNKDCPVSKLTFEDHFQTALSRLYRLKRLKEMEAPQAIIEQTDELLSLSRERVGERWPEVEEAFPSYYRFKLARDKADLAWEKRCEECKHFLGYDHFGSDDDASVLADVWCRKYNYSVAPRPCSDWEKKS